MAIMRKVRGAASEAVGQFNESTRRLLDLLDPQQKNLFEMVIYPANIGVSNPLSALSAGMDLLVYKLYLQTMTIPFASLEYARADKIQYVTNIIPPEEVSFTFIEDEKGTVRTYVDKWMNEIYQEPTLPMFSNTNSWEFKANQEGANKNAMITLQQGSGIPSLTLLKLEGLKYKSMADITLGHGEGDPLYIEVTCKVDNVYWMSFGDIP